MDICLNVFWSRKFNAAILCKEQFNNMDICKRNMEFKKNQDKQRGENGLKALILFKTTLFADNKDWLTSLFSTLGSGLEFYITRVTNLTQ